LWEKKELILQGPRGPRLKTKEDGVGGGTNIEAEQVKHQKQEGGVVTPTRESVT